MRKKVSVLFVRKDSIYKSLGVDCWDKEKDARFFPGGNPVVCHPPCAQWGKLRGLANYDADEKLLAVIASEFVRICGGVLEHPAGSKLFGEILPLPGKGVDKWGGYSICIDQFWFGHKAQKRTLLYIKGCSIKDLPPIPIRFDAITHVVDSNSRSRNPGRPGITKAEREHTPIKLAKWLVRVARLC